MPLSRKVLDSFNDLDDFDNSDPDVREYYAAWVAAAEAEDHDTIEDLADAAIS